MNNSSKATLTAENDPNRMLMSEISANLDNGIRALPRFQETVEKQEDGTVRNVSDMNSKQSVNRSPAEELHHIAEQLDELVQLIKNSTIDNTERAGVKPSSTNNEVMTVKEAAAEMRVSLPTMYEFARSGQVHSLQIGRRILISRSSLMALLQQEGR